MFVIAFVSAIMALIVIVNNHCDRVRDGDRVFVCMTVIVIVTVTLIAFNSFFVDRCCVCDHGYKR